MGPSIAVHLWEVSTYERLKNANTVGVTVMHSNPCTCKILVNAQKCNYGKTVPKKYH